MARRYWRDLLAANALHLPQEFTFIYQCPSEYMALGLVRFLRHSHHPGHKSSNNRLTVSTGEPWQVAGTTRSNVWSLSSLEHLFMGMRKAGPRYESALVNLDLVSTQGSRQ